MIAVVLGRIDDVLELIVRDAAHAVLLELDRKELIAVRRQLGGHVEPRHTGEHVVLGTKPEPRMKLIEAGDRVASARGEILAAIAELGIVDEPTEAALEVIAVALVDRDQHVAELRDRRVDPVDAVARAREAVVDAAADVGHLLARAGDAAIDPIERAIDVGARTCDGVGGARVVPDSSRSIARSAASRGRST